MIGTRQLLKAARRVWLEERRLACHRFHHGSTNEVYGSLQPGDAAFSETTAYAPNSPFLASEVATDHVVHGYDHTYGLRTTMSNRSDNCGPSNSAKRLIPLVIVNIMTGKPFPIYGDGRVALDWLYVTNFCRAIELVLTKGAPRATYDIGSDADNDNLIPVKMLCGIIDALFLENMDLKNRFHVSPAASGAVSAGLIRFANDQIERDRCYVIDAA